MSHDDIATYWPEGIEARLASLATPESSEHYDSIEAGHLHSDYVSDVGACLDVMRQLQGRVGELDRQTANWIKMALGQFAAIQVYMREKETVEEAWDLVDDYLGSAEAQLKKALRRLDG